MTSLNTAAAGVATADTRPSNSVRRQRDNVAATRQAQGGGALRVGALTPLAAELTTPILAAYREIHPHVRLAFVDVAGHGGDQALLEGRVDAAFLWTPVRWESLRVVELFTDRLVALLGAGHHLAPSRALYADSLADEKFTMSESMSDRWRHASALPTWRKCPERAVWVDSPRSALEAIASGRAVSIGPASLARFGSVPGVVCVPLLVPHGPRAVVATRYEESRLHVLSLLDVSERVAATLGHLVPTATRPERADRGLPRSGVVALTRREQQVLQGIATGVTARRVGHLLGISERTVHKHLEHIYAKFDVDDRVSAVTRGRAEGYLT